VYSRAWAHGRIVFTVLSNIVLCPFSHILVTIDTSLYVLVQDVSLNLPLNNFAINCQLSTVNCLIRYQQLGDIPGALADLNLAILLNPRDASVHNTRGLIKYELGDNGQKLLRFDRHL